MTFEDMYKQYVAKPIKFTTAQNEDLRKWEVGRNGTTYVLIAQSVFTSSAWAKLLSWSCSHGNKLEVVQIKRYPSADLIKRLESEGERVESKYIGVILQYLSNKPFIVMYRDYEQGRHDRYAEAKAIVQDAVDKGYISDFYLDAL